MPRTINIDDLIGVPYQVNGRGNPGYDCYGYAIEVCKRFGKTLPEIDGCMDIDYDFLECFEKGLSLGIVKEIPFPQTEGDLVFFKGADGMLNHIGVYLGFGLVTHCNSCGVHVEKLKRKEHFIGRCFTWL